MIRRLIILALAFAGATWLLNVGYRAGVKQEQDKRAKEGREAHERALATSRRLAENARKRLADHEPTDGEAVPPRVVFDQYVTFDHQGERVDPASEEATSARLAFRPREGFSFNETVRHNTSAPATDPATFYRAFGK